ncbi:MAG: hypothetical protein ACLTTJ_09910 [Blautia sp.]
MGSIKTAEGTCQSPLHTPGWVRWEELFKTEGGKNGLGYSNKKVVVTGVWFYDIGMEKVVPNIHRYKNQVIFQGIFR